MMMIRREEEKLKATERLFISRPIRIAYIDPRWSEADQVRDQERTHELTTLKEHSPDQKCVTRHGTTSMLNTSRMSYVEGSQH